MLNRNCICCRPVSKPKKIPTGLRLYLTFYFSAPPPLGSRDPPDPTPWGGLRPPQTTPAHARGLPPPRAPRPQRPARRFNTENLYCCDTENLRVATQKISVLQQRESLCCNTDNLCVEAPRRSLGAGSARGRQPPCQGRPQVPQGGSKKIVFLFVNRLRKVGVW